MESKCASIGAMLSYAVWLSSFTNVSDEITGAQKLLMRIIAAGLSSSFCVDVASPIATEVAHVARGTCIAFDTPIEVNSG